MEKNNIVKKIKSSNDSRINKIVLTNSCLEKLCIVREKAINYEKKMISDIKENELDIFFKVIEKIKENISK